MDLLTPLIWIAFYLLFLVAIRRYLLHRTRVDRGVMLVFASTAGLFALSLVNVALPSASAFLGPVLIGLLVAQPALMLSLVGQVVRLQRWVLPVAWAGCALVVFGFYATNRSVASVLVLILFFGLVEVTAAGLLIREARSRHGLPRARLTLAGLGSLLFGLSIVVAGLSSAARGGGADPTLVIVTRLIALLAGISYLGAFAPPRWVLRLAHRALAFDLIRSIVASPSGSQPEVLWRALATAVGQILGTPLVQVVADERVLVEGPVSLQPGQSDSPIDSLAWIDPPNGHDLEIPLMVDSRRAATVRATLGNRALFLEDDIALIQTLGSLTARAVEREQAVARLTDASRAVAEAEAVRASESRFRALIDADPNAILAVDESLTIRWATRSAVEIFRAPDDQLIGKPLEEVLPGRTEFDLRPSPKDPVRFEALARRRDGETFPAEVTITHFEYDAAPYRLVVVSDVAWRHEANAVRERFIGVLSHELRTPITAIYGGTQVLLTRAGQLDPETQSELLTDIAGEAERLQRMIENLLVLARVESGAEVAEAGPVLLHRVLPDVIAREQAMWPEIRIGADMPASLPLVAGDEASLALVLRNLISNAGKYAGPGAAVTVVTAVEASEVCVRVLDDGPGVDADEAERLFDLYFRSKGTHAMPGSGIGLFVCRQLISGMGGRTWAVSRPEGGAEFGFTLPIYRDAETEAAVDPSPSPARRHAAAMAES